MRVKFGVFCADSHGQLHRNAFVARMSARKFGDAIPQVRETWDPAHKADPGDEPVERWFINGKVGETRGVSNCPAAMGDPLRRRQPQRWEEVPKGVYDPLARLAMRAADGVDGEVLFPNPPVQGATFFHGDAEFEAACVRAYNDAMAEDWRDVCDHFVPIALLPYLGGMEGTVAELERVARLGYRGVLMVAEPGEALRRGGNWGTSASNSAYSLPPFADPYWEPLWAACQDVGMPVHWHANAGLGYGAPAWGGWTRQQLWATRAPPGFTALAQFLPTLAFSGILRRYPRLKWVCAETAIGWLDYVLDACDHEWERRRLWTDGIPDRPSEAIRRQIYMSSWFERDGVRHTRIAPDNVMWQSDFPHSPSTFPDSRRFISSMLEGIDSVTRSKILLLNAAALYRLDLVREPASAERELA